MTVKKLQSSHTWRNIRPNFVQHWAIKCCFVGTARNSFDHRLFFKSRTLVWFNLFEAFSQNDTFLLWWSLKLFVLRWSESSGESLKRWQSVRIQWSLIEQSSRKCAQILGIPKQTFSLTTCDGWNYEVLIWSPINLWMLETVTVRKLVSISPRSSITSHPAKRSSSDRPPDNIILWSSFWPSRDQSLRAAWEYIS